MTQTEDNNYTPKYVDLCTRSAQQLWKTYYRTIVEYKLQK